MTRSEQRRRLILTIYLIVIASILAVDRLSAPAHLTVEDELIFISDTDSIDASRESNSVYRIGLDGRGLKRIVGSIPHGEGYLRTSDIDCHAATQSLVIASQRRDLNGFHHALLDGTGLHLDKPAAGDLLSGARHIAIAPDGERVIVSREYAGFSPPRYGLVAGDLISRVFKTIKAPTAERSYLSPDFSPSGRQIAYIIERLNSDKTKTYQIATTGPTSAFEDIVYETTLKVSDVAWSPDGVWIAVVVERQVYRIRRYGGNLIRLTDHLGGASSPRWSPGGAQISYVSPSTFPGQNQLIVMNADGTGVRRVANIRGDVVNGCWV